MLCYTSVRVGLAFKFWQQWKRVRGHSKCGKFSPCVLYFIGLAEYTKSVYFILLQVFWWNNQKAHMWELTASAVFGFFSGFTPGFSEFYWLFNRLQSNWLSFHVTVLVAGNYRALLYCNTPLLSERKKDLSARVSSLLTETKAWVRLFLAITTAQAALAFQDRLCSSHSCANLCWLPDELFVSEGYYIFFFFAVSFKWT